MALLVCHLFKIYSSRISLGSTQSFPSFASGTRISLREYHELASGDLLAVARSRGLIYGGQLFLAKLRSRGLIYKLYSNRTQED